MRIATSTRVGRTAGVLAVTLSACSSAPEAADPDFTVGVIDRTHEGTTLAGATR